MTVTEAEQDPSSSQVPLPSLSTFQQEEKPPCAHLLPGVRPDCPLAFGNTDHDQHRVISQNPTTLNLVLEVRLGGPEG